MTSIAIPLRAIALVGAALGALSTANADTKALVEPCADCHGKDGASTESDIPIIGGYSEQYVIDSLTNYKNGDRPCPEVKYRAGAHKGEKTDMCTIAKKLSDEDMKLIGAYFAAKPFVRAKQTFDPEKAKLGKKIQDVHCKKCHEDGGSSQDDDAGILAGQWMPYIRHTFEEFNSGERPMPKKMKPKMEKLSKEDIDALVNYFGSFQ
jgi:sulfide dehydrogenase cytochrome subunit